MATKPHPNQQSLELHTTTRKRRKDAGHPRWQERDYDVLPWIGEQGLIRFDQLQRLLGRESTDLKDWQAVLSESATRNAINRWEARHLVNTGAVMPKEPKYYWLSNAGLAFAELSLPHYRPKASEVPYLLACNQARLHLELLNRIDRQEFGNFEECFWVSEREIHSRDPESELHRPSGEFWTQTRGTLAIEVVIGPKPQMEQVMLAYVQDQHRDYSEVWYLALSSQLPLLEETREKLKQSDVDVRRISLFKADAILIPSPRPKRGRKKG